MKKNPAGGLSDFAQPLFVELRFHNLSSGIFPEGGSAVTTVNWNERALWRADANRENLHACIRRGFRSLRRIAAEFFSVGENDQRAISGRAFSKRVNREVDRFGNIRSAFGNCFRIE